MKEALYYQKLKNDNVRCVLCPHECLIRDNKIGICRGKENHSGTLYAINYALTTSLCLDPIEKKPFYHFYPGRKTLSIGPNGCNMSCKFCQNWQISQKITLTNKLSPEEAVEAAIKSNSVGISYTYCEPFVWYEYVLNTAYIAKKQGLKNILVTNGYINEEPLKKILPLIDAMNIDVKSMDNEFYKNMCGATLAPVLRTVELAADECHVEVTNLVIPTLNDTDELFHAITDWLASINPNIPMHFSRYSPRYRMSIPSTTDNILWRALEIGSQKLNYVYVGNSAVQKWNNTQCHNCKKTVISRSGFDVTEIEVSNGKCNYCGNSMPIQGL